MCDQWQNELVSLLTHDSSDYKMRTSIVLSYTQRFHVYVRVLSNWSQMSSKCDKNKNAPLDFINFT